MLEIDRLALLIKPRQAFRDWLNQNSEEKDIDLSQLTANCTVLLIPMLEEDWAIEQYVQTIAKDLFETELAAWCMDETAWPKARDYNAFMHYFEIEVHDLVLDNVVGDYDYEEVTLQ